MLAVTLHVLTFNAGRGISSRTLGYNFHTIFLPDDAGRFTGDPEDNPTGTRVFLFSPADFEECVSTMLSRYWSLPSIAMLPVEVAAPRVDLTAPPHGRRSNPFTDAAGDLPPPEVTYAHYEDDDGIILSPSGVPFGLTTVTDVFSLLSPADTFPIDDYPNGTALRGFFTTLITLRYALPFRVWAAGSGPASSAPGSCERWTIDLTYDYTSRGQVEVTWDYVLLGGCGGGGQGGGGGGGLSSVSPPLQRALCSVTLVLCILLGGLVALDVTNTCVAFCRVRARQVWQAERGGGGGGDGDTHAHATYARHDDGGKPGVGAHEHTQSSGGDDMAPASPFLLRHALLLVDPWVATSTVAAAALSVHCIAVLGAGANASAAPLEGLPLALSTALLWLGCLGHARGHRRLYSNVLTLSDAAPRVLAFLIAPAPILVSFAMFALVFFGHNNPRYATPTLAFSTLFAFYNGDALVETYEHTEAGAKGDARVTFVGDAFLVVLTLLFTYIVSNIMVAVVESAFFANFNPAAVAAAEEEGEGGGGSYYLPEGATLRERVVWTVRRQVAQQQTEQRQHR